MGESRKDALRVNFDKKMKLEFHRTNAGLLAYWELDEALGLTSVIEPDFFWQPQRQEHSTQYYRQVLEERRDLKSRVINEIFQETALQKIFDSPR